MISVLILTLNEERNISGCIDSVSWSDDIVVLDSLSKDKTVDIATTMGARVVQHEFTNWSEHQNWAVNSIRFKYGLVFYLDADERCGDDLKKELNSSAFKKRTGSAFCLRRKDYFNGRWLKRAQLYPTWITRVFRPDKIRYERLVNPVAVVDGPTEKLLGHLIHYPFSHGIGHWIERHNRYSQFEAEQLLAEVQQPNDYKGLLDRDYVRRRKALKRLAYGIPGRPLWMFLYLVLIRGGLLDGAPGIAYAMLRSIYEYLIDLKVIELRRREQGLDL